MTKLEILQQVIEHDKEDYLDVEETVSMATAFEKFINSGVFTDKERQDRYGIFQLVIQNYDYEFGEEDLIATAESFYAFIK